MADCHGDLKSYFHGIIELEGGKNHHLSDDEPQPWGQIAQVQISTLPLTSYLTSGTLLSLLVPCLMEINNTHQSTRAAMRIQLINSTCKALKTVPDTWQT